MIQLKKILFYQQLSEIDTNNAYIINVYGIKTKKELLYLFFQSLNFPDYFGFNWDALKDSLCYLNEWTKEKKIIIVHNGLPNLVEKDLRNYFAVLVDVCDFWNNHPGILEMKVYFHSNYINIIQDLLETEQR